MDEFVYKQRDDEMCIQKETTNTKKREEWEMSEGRAAGVTESSPTSSIIRQEDDIVAHKKRDSAAEKKTTTKYTVGEMKYVSNFKNIFASFLFSLSVRVESSHDEVFKTFEKKNSRELK